MGFTGFLGEGCHHCCFDHQFRGFFDLVCDPGRADGVLAVMAPMVVAHPAALGGRGVCGEHGRSALAGQPECAVPRLPL